MRVRLLRHCLARRRAASPRRAATLARPPLRCCAARVSLFSAGTKERAFGHAIVVGLDRAPRKLTKAMGKKAVEKRSRVTPFVKRLNYRCVCVCVYVPMLRSARLSTAHLISAPPPPLLVRCPPAAAVP